MTQLKVESWDLTSAIHLTRRLVLVLLLASVFGITACAQDTAPIAAQEPPRPIAPPAAKSTAAQRPPADPSKFAIIISGISGEEEYAKQFSKWTDDLYSALTQRLSFDEKRVHLLTEKPGEGAARATADEVRKVFAAVQAAAKPDNSVFIFFIGHGSFSGKEAKFNLIGPDLSADEYAALIGKLFARQVVIINMASASGEFIKPLSAARRITITATRSGQEQNATRFAEHFIAALNNPDADADKNERVSVLEAFTYATKLTAEWYQKEGRLATEHALLDDNGDGVGHQKAESGDGGLAKTTYFDSLPQVQAGGDAELAKLLAERGRLEGEVEQLKTRKDKMKEDEYEAALEKLLVELAQINQKIKAKQK
jgi:hypothetical protein